MSAVVTIARGLRARFWLSALLLLVSASAVTVAASGPTYQTAAQRSVLRDVLADNPASSRGIDVYGGGILAQAPQLWRFANNRDKLGAARSDFGPAINYLLVPFRPTPSSESQFVARTDVCTHVRMIKGSCPTKRDDAMVTAQFAAKGWRLGSTITDVPSKLKLKIVGIYTPRDAQDDYWFGAGYFPQQAPGADTPSNAPDALDARDAVITPFETLQLDSIEGTAGAIIPLAADRVRPEDLSSVRAGVENVQNSVAEFKSMGIPSAGVNTDVADAVDQAQRVGKALRIPMLIGVVQVLVLVWMLLFVFLTAAMEARATDIALAKVRGLAGRRLWQFGLAEPVSLLLLSAPVGLLGAWLLTRWLGAMRLRDGVQVALTSTSYLTAIAVVLAGVVAAAVVMFRIQRRPVLDQWTRTTTEGALRGWTIDVALLVAAGFATFQLLSGGKLGSGQGDQLASLAPGIIGIGCAVVASRVLPLVCRALFGVTRRGGGLPLFLAVRQLARRPAGMRAMMILTAAWALVTFGIASLGVADRNASDIAGVTVGAPVVASVIVPSETDLAAVVDKLDPSGHKAMAVIDFPDPASGREFVGVEPDRWRRITFWRTALSQDSVAQLAEKMKPAAAPPAPVVIRGDALRFVFKDVRMPHPLVVDMTNTIRFGTGIGRTPLGQLSERRTTLTAPVGGCPCKIRNVAFEPRTSFAATKGTFRLSRIDERVAGRWQPLEAGLGTEGRWKFSGRISYGGEQVTRASTAGLGMSFTSEYGDVIGWAPYYWPVPMPAVTSASTAKDLKAAYVASLGLDGNKLAIKSSATAVVPGFGESVMITDRTGAVAAATDTRRTVQQVWMTRAARGQILSGLTKAGLEVTGLDTIAKQRDALLRKGPALAQPLTLALALAAIALAGIGSIATLVAAARRRRFELAALMAGGASQRELIAATTWEQSISLGMSIVVGIGSGLLAAVLALPSVPEFIDPPDFLTLHYSPNWPALLWPLALLVLALGVAMYVASRRLVSGTDPSVLRGDGR